MVKGNEKECEMRIQELEDELQTSTSNGEKLNKELETHREQAKKDSENCKLYSPRLHQVFVTKMMLTLH